MPGAGHELPCAIDHHHRPGGRGPGADAGAGDPAAVAAVHRHRGDDHSGLAADGPLPPARRPHLRRPARHGRRPALLPCRFPRRLLAVLPGRPLPRRLRPPTRALPLRPPPACPPCSTPPPPPPPPPP